MRQNFILRIRGNFSLWHVQFLLYNGENIFDRKFRFIPFSKNLIYCTAKEKDVIT